MSKGKVIIIGAGPSGVSAAVQLKREGINPVLIEKKEAGGLIVNANKIENYIGFPKGISGKKFAELLKRHLEEWYIEVVEDKVINCEYAKDESTGEGCFKVICEGNEFESEYLIIATGTKPVKPKYVEIPEDCSDFVYNEIYPILKEQNKNITIIGGGDAAFDYAMSLGVWNKINICNRSDRIRALDLLVKRTKEISNIKYYAECVLRKITKKKAGLELEFRLKSRKLVIGADMLIFAIGRDANIDFLGKALKKKFKGLIRQKRLFLIGDIKNDKYRQLSVSCGDGVKAAMEVASEIRRNF